MSVVLVRLPLSFAASEVIQSNWNLKRYLDRGRYFRAASESAANDESADVDPNNRYASVSKMAVSVDSTIQSNFFWVFMELLHSLNGVLTHMTNWSHGCICHSCGVREVG